MKFNFLYYFLHFSIFLFVVSCSNQRLEQMGVTKKKPNQFSVSRKAPLAMPPDMLLRPPKLENNEIKSNIDLDDQEISLDDILEDKIIPEEKQSKYKNKKSLKDKIILKKILNTEATNLK